MTDAAIGNAQQPQDGSEDSQSAEPQQPVDWKAKYEAAIKHSREWESRAKANKDAADELDRLKESQLSETEKLTRRAEKAEKELSALKTANQVDAWKNAAAEQYGVPASLLSGATEDEINARAKALAEWKNPKRSGASMLGDPSGLPQNPPKSADEWIRSVAKHNR